MVTVALLTAVVKLVTGSRESIIAWRFGTGDALDAFLIAFLIPSFIINLVAGSFNASFIPTYIQVREQDGLAAAQKLFSGAMVWSLGLLGITTLISVATAPVYLRWIGSGFGPAKLKLTFYLLCMLAPIILLNGVVIIWSAALNAMERFALTALAPIITPLATIIFLIAFRGWGVFALSTGVVCGGALELLLLGWALRRRGYLLRPRWNGLDPNLRTVGRQYAPMIAGAFLMCSTNLVDQSMAAMLPAGSVATINYGSKVVLFILTLMGTSLGTVLIPYFSNIITRKEWLTARQTFRVYLQLIFLVTVPLTLLIVFLSRPLVEILFQRGSFTPANAQSVARVQALFALQIPFFVAGILTVRLISSIRANDILLKGAAINLVVNIVLNYLFMKWIGLAGIALSTSCVYLISFGFCYAMVNRRISKLEHG